MTVSAVRGYHMISRVQSKVQTINKENPASFLPCRDFIVMKYFAICKIILFLNKLFKCFDKLIRIDEVLNNLKVQYRFPWLAEMFIFILQIIAILRLMYPTVFKMTKNKIIFKNIKTIS